MACIIPLRTGWGPNLDGSADYPDDLPEDWRLTYFANVFWGVLVPESLWSAAGSAAVSCWVADTPARFRFYLDVGRRASLPLLAPVVQTLGERLGGLIVGESAPAVETGIRAVQLRRVPGTTGRRGVAGAGGGLAHEAPPALIEDLAAARRWIEERLRETGARNVQQPAVALLGDCCFANLGRWQTMVELMGLA